VIAIFLAVTFIYMVLASQFNSFIYPFSIMSSLPLSVPAGLLSLMAFGMTLNVYSAIGMLMLFGTSKRTRSCKWTTPNTLRAQGMERHAADCVRPRRRCGIARFDGGHNSRRTGALPAVDPAGHAGRLRLLR